MKKIAFVIGGIAAAAVLAGGFAFAQSHGHGSRGMMGPGTMGSGMMGRGMMREMGPGQMGGGGMGMMGGMMGMGSGSATAAERTEIHDMLANHDRITRTVTNLPNGIRTVTESDDPDLAATIANHVAGMRERVREGRDPKLPIQSPTLQIIFRNKDKIETTHEATAKGVVVTQTSNDPETVAALQKHAAEVTDLVKRGMAAAHENMMRNRGMMHGAAAAGDRHRH